MSPSPNTAGARPAAHRHPEVRSPGRPGARLAGFLWPELAREPRSPVLLWRIAARRPAAGPRRRHPRPDRRGRVRPRHRRPQRPDGAGQRARRERARPGIPRAARARFRRLPPRHRGAGRLGLAGRRTTRRHAHRHQLPGAAVALAGRATASMRRSWCCPVRWRSPRAWARPMPICDLVSSGATLSANQLKPVTTLLESEAVLAGPFDGAGCHARRTGRPAAAPARRRTAHPPQQVAAVPGAASPAARPASPAARCRNSHRDAPGRRRRPRTAGALPRRGDLATAGGTQARRCPRADGAAGGGHAGMNAVVCHLRRHATHRLAACRRAGARAPAPSPRAADLQHHRRLAVASILAQVRESGDAALRAFSAVLRWHRTRRLCRSARTRCAQRERDCRMRCGRRSTKPPNASPRSTLPA